MSPPVIETDRLRLRGWTEADFEPYARMNSDAEARRYLYPQRALTREESDKDLYALVAQWERLGWGHWAVEERETGRFVGRTGAKRHPDWDIDADHSEVGWHYDRAAWGRGFATEGARAAIRFLFEEVGRPEVISIAFPGNLASRRIMEKLGLRLRGERAWGRRGLHVVWYGATREEWAQAR